MSQTSCLDCFRKHIATAMVFEDEAAIGNAYPLHKWFAIGELNAAAKEVVKEYPILAQMTREFCRAYQDTGSSVPTEELIILANQLADGEEEFTD